MTLTRLKRPPLGKPHEPAVLLEKHGNIRRIAALDDPAIRAGLHLYQPLADALAIYPKLITADAEPEMCKTALAELALRAQRYSPLTAPAPHDGIWLDITGCAHLWGGEAELAEDLLGKLRTRGIPARAAIAPTFGAAYALAHHADPYAIAKGEAQAKELAALLAPLPPERLRISRETAIMLRKLGLFTIGAVQKLPRAGLARRFPDLLPQLDKAIGRVKEAIDFLRPPIPWIERLRFAEPVSAPEDLERITLKLLEMLCKRLQAGREGGLKFEIHFYRCDGEVQSQAVSTALPTRDCARIMRLFREKLGLIDPGFGVDLAMLAAPQTESLYELQSNILQTQKSAATVEDLAALIDALENRLGKGRVYRVVPWESYIPERALKRVAPLPSTSPSRKGDDSSEAAACSLSSGERAGVRSYVWKPVGERPIRLFARPQPIDATAALPDSPPVMFRWRMVLHRIARSEGPERISPEWWRGKSDETAQVRDYYRVESIQGLRFWVFREGVYGGKQLPRWYLHGVFP